MNDNAQNPYSSVVALKAPQIFQVPYWDVESLWPKCAPLLKKAIDTQNYWSVEGVYKALLNSPTQSMTNQMQLWYCPNKFALVTQIQINADGTTVCLLFLCGGQDIEAIKSAFEPVKAWSKKHFNCKHMRIVGRKGWVKLLGFEEKETIMECEI